MRTGNVAGERKAEPSAAHVLVAGTVGERTVETHPRVSPVECRDRRRRHASYPAADLQEPTEALAAKTADLKEKLTKLATEMQRLKAIEKEMLASPDADEQAKQDNRKAGQILRDEFLAAYDRLADGAPKTLGLDDWSTVRKVSADAIRDELKKRGFLEKNETGGLTDTGRSHFRRAKTLLLSAGKILENEDLIWRK